MKSIVLSRFEYNYHSKVQEAEKVVDDIKAADGEAFAIRANVANEDDVKSMFSQVFKEFGTIDILVINTSIQKDSSFVDMTLEEWNTVIGVNLIPFLYEDALYYSYSPLIKGGWGGFNYLQLHIKLV
ncbi:hypothetical protein DSM106972_032900 [Dulcicalothrix desertica PCC 7102]|uniref:Uncharacterized protein n=1 Tax=Dulcicalothrix desertica PCC 7102 TaxID=232991 RepID=A0A3S1CN21_9CYAN|nr:hypothetical protein DSM106972_032900 [Dulcicalothrix desertica PCC 7102]